MAESLVRYYREHDDFLRYSVGNHSRERSLAGLYSDNRAFFGRRILDIACGGGVLALATKGRGREYVGVDKDPDMIRSARKGMAEPHATFLQGDAGTVRLRGTFDTIALLGNSLIHFNASELSSVLANLDRNSRRGTHFIVEYRDVVSMLFDGKWGRRFVQRRGGRPIISRTKSLDAWSGRIRAVSGKGSHELEFTHAVWSPFILESVMAGFSWRLVRRKTRSRYLWLDVYRKDRA